MEEVKARIHYELSTKLNFACHQSAYAFLRDLQIENLDPESRIENAVLTLSSDPTFLKTKTWHVDRIEPRETLSLRERDVELAGQFLLGLTESVRGRLIFRLEQEGELLGEQTCPIELLAYNEWGGTAYMPELLAAFSMPNDPAIDNILRDASIVLRKAGKEGNLDGYTSRSRSRVWDIASAIYSAIANLQIAYANPPASFEKNGQKIRLPGQILAGGVATCLDTAMLFSSVLEQVGLNSIIVMPEGHALVGVWLQQEELATVVIDEAETLRKRVQSQELILIETTCVTHSPAPLFSKALKAANATIEPELDGSFCAAVGIRRARAHKITPLGLRTERTGASAGDKELATVTLAMEDAPSLPPFEDNSDEIIADTPKDRIDRWQRKLLDLTARNSLLNHRSSKSSLHLLCPDPGRLEDILATGKKISIQPAPQLSGSGQDETIYRERTGEGISEEYAYAALEKQQVLVSLNKEELTKRSIDIYRKAQTSLQEGGSNTLFLAIGFLLWRPDEKSDKRYRAPLILLPITRLRQSVRSGIKMTVHDDEPRFNTTLLEMLKRDYRITIGGLDGELPSDDSGIDVAGIWGSVRRSIKEVPGFEVIEDVVLGHFSFAKYLMWKDLVDRNDLLRQNPVVRHLIDTPRDSYPSDVEFVRDQDLDREFTPADLLTPLSADSSQMASIATAHKGKDFIIIGPPGTGKSQTISNMIAHLIGQGKTVLFVSEKTAALDVVYRRLEEVDLGRFCLALHSNKASKSDVLKQLDRSWQARGKYSKKGWERKAVHLQKQRDQLNRLVQCLHKEYPNGLTPHQAIV